jgi:hypothetical protein
MLRLHTFWVQQLETNILLAIAARVSLFFMQATPTIASVTTLGIAPKFIKGTVVTTSEPRRTIRT